MAEEKTHIFAFVIYVCVPTDKLIVLRETGFFHENQWPKDSEED